MTYIITQPCINVKDASCLEVCPVDCIHPRKDEPDFEEEVQLYIDPDVCIDCGACEPECPWEAITAGDAVPDLFTDDTPLTARCDTERDLFVVAKKEDKPRPSVEEVQANKAKWGL
jgi:ferredoxin